MAKFLDNSKGIDIISLLVKYYGQLANINKVIKLCKCKFAMNPQCFNESAVFLMGGAIRRVHSIAKNLIRFRSLDCASH